MPRTRKTTFEEPKKQTKVGKPKTSVVAKPVRRPQRAGSLKADVYNIKGKVVETISLPKDIFASKINPTLMSQAVRVYLANQRRGTVSTKSRGEVKGSSRKIYRQKGTGRARHGSLRAPIFVKGGLVFGPKPRDYSLKLPTKMKRAALFSALSAKVKYGEFRIIAGLEKIQPKTKEMVSVLTHLGMPKKTGKVLLILPSDIEVVKSSARNIDGVSLTEARLLNTYEVLNNKVLLFMKESVLEVEKVFGKRD